jgi:hypothetical protein
MEINFLIQLKGPIQKTDLIFTRPRFSDDFSNPDKPSVMQNSIPQMARILECAAQICAIASDPFSAKPISG